MSDRDQIAEMLANYSWMMDAGDFEALNDVFTDDASFLIHIAGADSIGPIEGREAIIEFIGNTVSGQQDQRRHVISNQRFESHDGEEAVITATLTLNVIAKGSLEVKATGVYRAELVRADGDWKMEGLTISLDLPF